MFYVHDSSSSRLIAMYNASESFMHQRDCSWNIYKQSIQRLSRMTNAYLLRGSPSSDFTVADGLPSPSALREVRAVMASTSPPLGQYGNPAGGSGYGSGQSENGKSPLSMSLGFLKNLTEKKNTRGAFDSVSSLSALLIAVNSRWTAPEETWS